MVGKERRINFGEFMPIILLGSLFVLVVNRIIYGIGILEGLPGMLIIIAIAVAGIVLSKLVPVKLPPVLYISLTAILLACPASPVSETVIRYGQVLNGNSFLTPALCFAGVIMAKNWRRFKEIGLKGLVIAFLVILGTYLGSALVADGVLRMQGII